MGKPRVQTVRAATRGWEPTLTQVAERANLLWHQEGCPAASELGYWMRARQQLQQEHWQLLSTDDYSRAVAGL